MFVMTAILEQTLFERVLADYQQFQHLEEWKKLVLVIQMSAVLRITAHN